ncbi:MAG: TolC family protein [Paludibacter sp.]|jgi:outer membrane protein TolC|nr:TolC family protein [Paludibacter sp.]MDD3359391.1 TolC family protein [Parabacteroides sp.]MDD4405231.1 TolC family protein [Parabacteroides sp.]
MKTKTKTIVITILAILTVIPLFAQNDISSVLDSIEGNNTTLKALRETADAQKLGNKTGIYLSNPEVGFNYLWGKPGDIGNRTDINIKQNFDIPTITGMKSRVSNGQNNLVEWQYKADRMNILLEAKLYCIELVYYNAQKRELDVRLQHAETIAKGYKDRLERGDANLLEYNKIQLNLASVQGELSRVEVERNALLSQLKRLNGGVEIVLNENRHTPAQLPLNFDSWYVEAEQKNPVLAYVKQEIEVGKSQVSLSKSSNLPTFSAGYMSEKVVGQQYQGLTFSISIPLWENKNRVKQAKAAVTAAELREADSKQQFYSQLRTLYNRANSLNIIADKYRHSLATVNNTELLNKALDAGEISLLDYIVEIGLYYTTVSQALEAERDYQKAFAELSSVEL